MAHDSITTPDGTTRPAPPPAYHVPSRPLQVVWVICDLCGAEASGVREDLVRGRWDIQQAAFCPACND